MGEGREGITTRKLIFWNLGMSSVRPNDPLATGLFCTCLSEEMFFLHFFNKQGQCAVYVDLSILLEVDLSFHLEDVNRTERIAMNLEATDTVEVQMFNQSCAVTCKQ